MASTGCQAQLGQGRRDGKAVAFERRCGHPWPKWAIDAKTLAPKYWPSEQGKGQYSFHTCFLILFAPTKCRKDASPILQNARMSEAAAFDFVPVVRNDKRQVISVHFKLIGELRHAQKLFKYAVHVKKFYHFSTLPSSFTTEALN